MTDDGNKMETIETKLKIDYIYIYIYIYIYMGLLDTSTSFY